MSTLIGILLQASLPILFWHGISAKDAPELLPLLKESGADLYLCRYKDADEAVSLLDAAAECGVRVYIGFPELISDPEVTIPVVKSHPALEGFYLKDEPEIWDIEGLGKLVERFHAVDANTPCYINLYPNWAWNEEEYASRIEIFADKVDVPFYSFDQYPVTEVDGEVVIRPTWYRNLEEFSAMARRHGKPFWAFALTTSHHLGAPSPPAFYPVPTLGTLRLQVMSNLLYGAQCIQYFTFSGLYNQRTLEKTTVFDIVKDVNQEVKALSPVFYGAEIKGVWHCGKDIPPHTRAFSTACVPSLKRLVITGEGALVSLFENNGNTYLAVQNKDCVNESSLDIAFRKNVTQYGGGSARVFKLTILPGDVAVFEISL